MFVGCLSCCVSRGLPCVVCCLLIVCSGLSLFATCWLYFVLFGFVFPVCCSLLLVVCCCLLCVVCLLLFSVRWLLFVVWFVGACSSILMFVVFVR